MYTNFVNTPIGPQTGPVQSGDKSQIINITDLICEGPIKGLVGEESGVYLNDSPAIDAEFAGSYTSDGVGDALLPSISFNGTTSVGTSTAGFNTGVAPNVENRVIELDNYQTTSVSVTNSVSIASGVTNIFVSRAENFTAADWNTSEGPGTRRATLKAEGYTISGSFKRTSDATASTDAIGQFIFLGSLADMGFDSSKTHTLSIKQGFLVQSVARTGTKGTGVTLKNSVVPAAGTYDFKLLPAGTIEELNVSVPGNFNNFNKVDNFNVQFVDGSLFQNALDPINGVGGSVAISGNLSLLNLVELKQLQQSVATTKNIDLLDSGGYPTGQTSNADGAADVTKLTPAVFGLDSDAKRDEADEVSFTIQYPALQAIRNRKSTKHVAYAFYEVKIFLDGASTDDWRDGINCFPSYGKHVIHSGNTTAGTSFQHIIGLNQFRPFTTFEIQVVRTTRHAGLRVTADGTRAGQDDQNYFSSIMASSISQAGAVIRDKFRYPYSSIASLTFSSKKFKSIPKRSYDLQGLKVQIPDTYTPREYSSTNVATYTGFWGGAFKDELFYTDNPAWVFYDIVTNNRYGAGQWIKSEDIDKYALYRIAKYCDELVPDGKGGTEPRFRANLFLTKATDVYKVLKDIASMFTGMLYWMDGQLTVVQDTPADSVYNFSKSNVIDGQFSYESTGSKTRANQIVVTWNDPEANYTPGVTIVEDRENIVRKGRIISESAVAFGATSEGQAIRYGRWKLWTSLNQTEVVSFKTGIQGTYIKPGDIINVQDADRYGVSYSGRISTYTPGTLVLDRPVVFNVGSSYTLHTLVTEPAAFYAGYEDVTIGGTTYSRGDRVPQAYVDTDGTGSGTVLSLTTLSTEARASNAFSDSNGTLPLEITWQKHSYVQSKGITNPAATTNTLSVTTDTAVDTDTVWTLTEVSNGEEDLASARKYRVMGVTKEGQVSYNVSAVEYYDSKFDAVDTDYELGSVPVTIYPEFEPESVPAPSDIYVVLETDATAPGEELSVHWEEPEDYEFIGGYELSHTISGIDSPISLVGTSYSFTKVEGGIHTFRVRTISSKNNKSPYKSINYNLEDIFDENIPRVQEGIPKGIIANSTFLISTNSSTASTTLRFDKNPASVVSIGASLSSSRSIDTADDISITSLTDSIEYSVLFHDSTLDLAHYDVTTLPSHPHWVLIDRSTSPPETAASYTVANKWTSVGSNVTCAANSTIVTGVGTTWLTTLKTRDLIIFGSTAANALSGGKAALVTSILSDTEIRIDNRFTTAQSSTGIFRRTYRADTNNDCIFATISRTIGGASALEKFITLDPSLEVGKYVSIDTSPSLLQYEFDSPNTQLGVPTSITATATAIGFNSPLFKFSAKSAGLGSTLDTSFQSPNNGDFKYDFTIDDNGAVDYNEGAIESATVQVVESSRPDDTFEGVGSIFKVKAGSEGLNGSSVVLDAEDYTIVYDAEGANPAYNNTIDPTASTLTFSATSQNFTAARYKFTFIGGTGATASAFTLVGFGSSFGEGNTATVSIPSSHTSWNSTKKQGSFQVKVEVAESDDTTTVLSSDTVTVQGIHSFKGGYWVSLSNEAHTIPTNSSGVPLSTGGVNSGTTIEVGQGNTILTYVSGTPTVGEYSITAAATPSGAITVATPNISNTSLISYPDHTVTTTASNWTQDTAAVTYTINLEDSVTILRRQTFTKSKSGVGGVAVTNSNASQALPADSSGKVFIYTDSGTDINVLLSGESLPYYANAANAATAGVNNFWNIGTPTVVPTGKITVGGRTPPSDGAFTAVTVANHSAMALDTDKVTISYPISIRVNGVDESLITSQSITKNTNGSAVFIESTSTHINFDSDVEDSTAASYTLNWSSILPSGVTGEKYKLDAGAFTTNTSSAISSTFATLPTTHTIELYNSDGTQLATDKVTISKSKDGAGGVTVRLSANKYAIPYSAAGTESSTISFTATATNLPSTVTYTFEVDSGSGFVVKRTASTTNTYTMAEADEPGPNDAHVVRVIVKSGETVVATDSVSVYGVQDGSDAVTIILSNEAHTVTASNAGAVNSFTGSGSTIQLYRGSTAVTANTSGSANTFQATASGTAISPSSPSYSSNTITYGAHSNMTADIASITYTITAYDATATATTYTKVQSFSKSKSGADPDALTVSSSYNAATGETTLTFSDGSTATVSNGDDGTSKGVKPLYAATANPTAYSQVSLTQGSNAFVNFYEFTGTYSALSDAATEALTFVKIVGEDGDSEGVIPIYAADGSGTSASFTQGSLGFVNFYEWAGTAPTSVPSGLTYVKFIGEDGADSTVAGPPGAASTVAGPTGPSGFLYYLSGSDSLASTGNIPNTLSPAVGQIAIVQNTDGAQKAYRYGGSSTGWVEQDLINTGVIAANAIQAEQLQISNYSGTNTTGISLDGTGTGPRIIVYDTNVARVIIGKLS